MRPAPASGPAPRTRRTVWSREVEVELVTRLFGGGARASELDEVAWLRPAALKSALRAWWRAGHCHDFKTMAALRAREQELFGSSGSYDGAGRPVGGPGLLAVTVETAAAAKTEAYGGKPSSPLHVALFAAAGMGKGKEAALLGLPGSTRAVVRLAAPEPASGSTAHDEILAALRLWLTLGGVGARTRRGAGAIAVVRQRNAMELGVAASVDELDSFLRAVCRPKAAVAELDGVFSLGRTWQVFAGTPRDKADDAQSALLSALRRARQDRPAAPAGRWGRSAWPEADAIRLKSRGRYRHAPDAKNAEQYPRAALGLPIVVHYKDSPPQEPPEQQILAARRAAGGDWDPIERYASPILLRSVAVWEKGQRSFVPVAVFTRCTLPADARPWVTTEPTKPPAPADVIAGYAIRDHAQETLARVAAAFGGEFRPLLGV
jgi:CRISPR-associated protein Cmr1